MLQLQTEGDETPSPIYVVWPLKLQEFGSIKDFSESTCWLFLCISNVASYFTAMRECGDEESLILG